MEKNSAGQWQKTTWKQFHEAVRDLTGRLYAAGVRSGDSVALMMANSVRWETIQHAVYCLGGIVVGMDRNDPAERIADLFSLCTPMALFVDDSCLLERVPRPALAALKLVVAERGPEPSAASIPVRLFAQLPPAARFDGAAAATDRPATVIFTSGTTGRPKALVYSHRQLALAVASVAPLLADLPDQAHTACWLPLANPFQRMTNWCAMAANWKAFMVSEPAKILEQVREIRPHFLVAVPRFYEKLHAGIRQRLEAMPGGMKAAAAWAQRIGGRCRREKARGTRLPWSLRCQYRLADRLVLQKIRDSMGGQLRYFISGSAPLSVALIEAFAALGWTILEAYGISENIIPMAMNAPGAYRPGSVGRPLANNDIRIAGDGEILVKGPGVAVASADPQAGGFLK
ncbi:MAG: AMP-binding protein, partial [Desulfatitalea sp.]